MKCCDKSQIDQNTLLDNICQGTFILIIFALKIILLQLFPFLKARFAKYETYWRRTLKKT